MSQNTALADPDEEVKITRDGAYDEISDAAAKAKKLGRAEIRFENEKYLLVRGTDVEELQCLFVDLEETVALSDKQVTEGNAKLYDREAFREKFGHLKTAGKKK